MQSNIYSPTDSPILLALFVQNPNLNEPQTIYGRESLTRGTLREIITTISLKTFLKNQQLSPSKKWYEVVKMMKRPGKKSEHPITFWIPRDEDLKIGVLNQALMPIQDQSGVKHCRAFDHRNNMCTLTQSRLNDIFQQGQPPALSTSSSDSNESRSITSFTFASSRRAMRKGPSKETTLPRLTSSSCSLNEPSAKLSISLEPAMSIPAIQPTSTHDVDQIYVKERNVYVNQSIYVMMEGKLQEITVASLQYLLQKQPRTRSRDAIHCAVFLDDTPTHFLLNIKSQLTIALLDSKLTPIKNKFRQTVARGLTHTSGEVSDSDLEKIQSTLDIWPNQYRPSKIGSASDPSASFRTIPPAHKMRPFRTMSGQLSSTGVEPIKSNQTTPASSSDRPSLRTHSDPSFDRSISFQSASTITQQPIPQSTSDQSIVLGSRKQ